METAFRRGADNRMTGLPKSKPYSREQVSSLDTTYARISDYILPNLQKLQEGGRVSAEEAKSLGVLVDQLEAAVEFLKQVVPSGERGPQDEERIRSLEGTVAVYKAFLGRL